MKRKDMWLKVLVLFLALVVAALAAEGHTEITCLTHLDRGYEELEDCLARTGAVIRRE